MPARDPFYPFMCGNADVSWPDLYECSSCGHLWSSPNAANACCSTQWTRGED